MDNLIDWFYGQVVGFLGNFFAEMGNMGVELFALDWVEAIVLFFSQLGWALFGVSLVVSGFEFGIEYSTGRGNLQHTALNAIKGFMAVSLFTVVPVRLYSLSVSLQGTFAIGLTGAGTSIGTVGERIIEELMSVESLADMAGAPSFGMSVLTSPIMLLFCIIMMAYAVIKVFFANLKRGGILLIQIAVGSLYMFSVPRGYTDGFVQWSKQVIGLCLTAFLQSTILVAGLMVFKDHALLGLGLMLSAGEVPRIAGTFGLDTTTRANIMSAVYTAQAAVNTTRTVVQAAAKYTITLNKTVYTMKKGKSVKLKAALNKAAQKEGVEWKSSNLKIATVSKSGKVTAKKNGKVTITATAADGSKKSGKVTLYVGKMIKSIDVTNDIWESTDKEGREIITLFVRSVKNKKTLQLSDKLVIHPITATNKKLTYKSSNSKLVSVSASGKLTAKKKGTEDVIITITANDGSRVKKEIVVKIMQK